MIRVTSLLRGSTADITFISINHNMTLSSCRKDHENHCVPKKILKISYQLLNAGNFNIFNHQVVLSSFIFLFPKQ